jgi:uncharacterized protein YkwD
MNARRAALALFLVSFAVMGAECEGAGGAPAAPQDPATSRGITAPERVVDLVNGHRAEQGCDPLTVAEDLTAHAQQWSGVIAEQDRLFHSDGPSGYGTWAENLTRRATPEAAVDSWLRSDEGHREAMLDCKYTLTGVGVAEGASGLYWTQVFAR